MEQGLLTRSKKNNYEPRKLISQHMIKFSTAYLPKIHCFGFTSRRKSPASNQMEGDIKSFPVQKRRHKIKVKGNIIPGSKKDMKHWDVKRPREISLRKYGYGNQCLGQEGILDTHSEFVM
ncbi:hypothetical protein SDJN02_00821, partial [Cucurbita argyrosperma subsp. argyrosperma]